MFKTVEFPGSVPHLDSSLSNVDANHLPLFFYIIIKISSRCHENLQNGLLLGNERNPSCKFFLHKKRIISFQATLTIVMLARRWTSRVRSKRTDVANWCWQARYSGEAPGTKPPPSQAPLDDILAGGIKLGETMDKLQ